jgi:hypothetical protein
MTASRAAVAVFRSPSRAASASMSSALFTVFLPNVRTDVVRLGRSVVPGRDRASLAQCEPFCAHRMPSDQQTQTFGRKKPLCCNEFAPTGDAGGGENAW